MYPRDPYKNPYNLLECDLKLLLNKNLVVSHNQFDVAVALIGKTEKIDSVNMMISYNESISKSNLKASHVHSFLPEDILESKDVPVGTEVHIFGYLTSLGIKEIPQLELTKPLLRRGIFAGKNYK